MGVTGITFSLGHGHHRGGIEAAREQDHRFFICHLNTPQSVSGLVIPENFGSLRLRAHPGNPLGVIHSANERASSS